MPTDRPLGALRGALGFVGVAGLLWLVAWSPVAPFPLAEGDRLANAGQIDPAVDHLDAVAEWHPSEVVRLAARRRAASLLAIEAGRASEARDRLQAVLEDEELGPTVRAELWSQLAHVLLQGLSDAEGASGAFLAAYDADREAPGAEAHLVAAARAHERAGQPDRAYQVWERLGRRHRDQRAAARLEQAAILLARGKVAAAKERYEEARASAPEGSRLAEVAQLGVATCLERQGLVDEALEELDGAGLSDEVLAPRQEALREREAGSD